MMYLYRLTDLLPLIAALCIAFLALGYLLGRRPKKQEKKRLYTSIPGKLCVGYNPANPSNGRANRTDGW